MTIVSFQYQVYYVHAHILYLHHFLSQVLYTSYIVKLICLDVQLLAVFGWDFKTVFT